MSWIDVAAIDDIPLRGARIVKTNVGCVALFRTDEAEVFATTNTCPHKQGPLAEGLVQGKYVTCPLHNWVWSLETGEAQGADEGKIATYPVKLEGGRILLDAASIEARGAA